MTFVVATGSFTLAGVGSAVWAMVAGLLAATVVELPELLACWREAGAER